MKKLTLHVGLKIPDSTAISALTTLKEMGYDTITALRREVVYECTYEGDEEEFKQAISTADILVNANKNTIHYEHKKQDDHISILVKDNEQSDDLKHVLVDKLGITQLLNISKATLWTFTIEKEKEETAKKAAQELLANPHYQSFTVHSS